MTATLNDLDQRLRLAKDPITGEIYRVDPDHDGKYSNAAPHAAQFAQHPAVQAAASGLVVLDFSLARFSNAQLDGAGCDVVCRYVCFENQLTTRKIIYKPEYDWHLSSGRGVHINHEWYEGRAEEGYQAGLFDGRLSLDWCRKLGYPKGWPVTYSDDQSTTPLDRLDAYLHGCDDGMGGYFRVGNYAPVNKLDAMLANGRAEFGWEPTAWSGGRISNRAHLLQKFGGAPLPGTDLNVVLREPAFPWYAGGSNMVQVDSFTQDALVQVQNAVLDEMILNYVITKPDPSDPTGKKQLPTESKFRSFVSDVHLNLHRMKDAALTAADIPTAHDIAAEVVAQLPGAGAGLTVAEVEGAMRRVLNTTSLTSPEPPPPGP